MPSHRSLRQAWEAGEIPLGSIGRIPHALATERLARCGFDFLVVDLQHGAVAGDTMLQCLMAARLGGASALVRTPSSEPSVIQHALDLGADGVIVPSVESGEDAARVAAACRYPPRGVRSSGQIRGGFGDRASADREVLCVAMVESRSGLDNVDEIAGTPGIDAIFFGPVDMALSLGCEPGDLEAEPLRQAMERVLAACSVHGLVAGRPALSPQDGAAAVAQGFRFLTTGGDVDFMCAGAMGAVEHLRGAVGGPPAGDEQSAVP